MSELRDHVRIGRAAEMLGVTVDTIRRWADEGRLTVVRSDGGQRLVPIAEVTRLRAERRQARSIGRSSPSPPATGSPAS